MLPIMPESPLDSLSLEHYTKESEHRANKLGCLPPTHGESSGSNPARVGLEAGKKRSPLLNLPRFETAWRLVSGGSLGHNWACISYSMVGHDTSIGHANQESELAGKRHSLVVLLIVLASWLKSEGGGSFLIGDHKAGSKGHAWTNDDTILKYSLVR
jgi:hypothetical protein